MSKSLCPECHAEITDEWREHCVECEPDEEEG